MICKSGWFDVVSGIIKKACDQIHWLRKPSFPHQSYLGKYSNHLFLTYFSTSISQSRRGFSLRPSWTYFTYSKFFLVLVRKCERRLCVAILLSLHALSSRCSAFALYFCNSLVHRTNDATAKAFNSFYASSFSVALQNLVLKFSNILRTNEVRHVTWFIPGTMNSCPSSGLKPKRPLNLNIIGGCCS